MNLVLNELSNKNISFLLSMISFSLCCSHGNLQHELFFISVDFFIAIATPTKPILQYNGDQNAIQNNDVR